MTPASTWTNRFGNSRTLKTIISSEHRDKIRHYGESTFPHECCGFLLGTVDDDCKTIAEIIPVINERTDSANNRYLISPDAYWEGEKQARSQGLEIVGIYHSHPNHPAEPSDYDREHAMPWLSYIIVAIENGQAQDLNSFVLSDDYTHFNPEPLDLP